MTRHRRTHHSRTLTHSTSSSNGHPRGRERCAMPPPLGQDVHIAPWVYAVTWTQSVTLMSEDLSVFLAMAFTRSGLRCGGHTPVVLTTFAKRENTLATGRGMWPRYKPTRNASVKGLKDLPPRRPPTAYRASQPHPLTPASASSTRWRDPAWPAAACSSTRASSP